MSSELSNHFYLYEFDDSMESGLIPDLTEEITKQASLADGIIHMHVNSFGGYAHIAWHIVELMEYAKKLGITVCTYVWSNAFSCGSIVAVAGSEGYRFISKDAEHLVHAGQIGSFETTALQVDRYTAWKKRHFKQVVNHYKKYADMPSLTEAMVDDGHFIVSKDAIKFKLADKIIDKYRVF